MPTRDFEFNFLADFLMRINQTLSSVKTLNGTNNLELLIARLTEAFKFHLMPFLLETGFTGYEQD